MAHPNDTLAALDEALKAMRELAQTDDLARLTYLPALEELRAKALQEARGA